MNDQKALKVQKPHSRKNRVALKNHFWKRCRSKTEKNASQPTLHFEGKWPSSILKHKPYNFHYTKKSKKYLCIFSFLLNQLRIVLNTGLLLRHAKNFYNKSYSMDNLIDDLKFLRRHESFSNKYSLRLKISKDRILSQLEWRMDQFI